MNSASNILRLVCLGPPGSGKGTICKRIAETFLLQHLSSGDALRDHVSRGTPLGKQVTSYLNQGHLVPDELVLQLMTSEIRGVTSGRGWILDGFPRTVAQAEGLLQSHSLSAVLYFNVPFETIVDRVKERWTHLPSGRVYNLSYNRPKVPGKDDVTGEPLSRRPDDVPETVLARLNNFRLETEPLLSYYRERDLLASFSGTESDSIWAEVKKYIETTLLM